MFLQSEQQKLKITFLQNVKNLKRHNVELARLAPPPSSATLLAAFQVEQNKHPVLNGRPSYNDGPLISLFHPVFNSFQATMIKEDPISTETYALVRSLFQASADLYEDKQARTNQITKHLAKLINSAFISAKQPDVLSDGVIMQSCGITYAYLGILEVKNGTAHSDPSIQGCLAYRKYWVSATSLAGPWLCVLGGVYPVVQPLTDYLWLGGDAFSDSQIFSVGVFNALKSAVSTLQQYYSPVTINAHDKPDGFPFIQIYMTEKFSYLEKLAEEYPNKLIYKAKLHSSGALLVVKFTSTYNAEAHRLLTDNQLAPALHYAGMEDTAAPKLDGEHPSGFLSEDQAGQIRKAVELLHSRKFVFGDLRLPNIWITEGRAMLIDFDWCSPADEGRYPMSLNQEDGIDWAEGIYQGFASSLEASDSAIFNTMGDGHGNWRA
ncbi:hypothetical protein K439DRAFT_1656135 [Ramaria rubella]|nr:hypothetical protein K439DRAFT_1656135 [Ramaria rubella]